MSESDKSLVPTKLLWVDLEMTGLDFQNDVIIEVAAEITDMDFKTIASYEALVSQPEEKLTGMNEWAQAQHDASGLTERVRQEGKPEEQVTQEFCDFIKKHFGDEPATLAGNSIHNDRNFMKQCWPAVDACLHYRMMDVSAWKIIMQSKYGVFFEKKDEHRALQDIQASIAELQYYLEWLHSHED